MSLTILQSIEDYLDAKFRARQSSYRTYEHALRRYQLVLHREGINPSTTSPENLSAETIRWLIDDVQELKPESERLYLNVVKDYLRYLVAEDISEINLAKVQQNIKFYGRKSAKRLPNFPEEAIEKLINFVDLIKDESTEDPRQRLTGLRDRAFILTLADTGLRVHEACNLTIGALDFEKRRAMIVGKGNKQRLVRFSIRSIEAIKDYLKECSNAKLKFSGRQDDAPIFSRHDRKNGKGNLNFMTTRTGQNILDSRTGQLLGKNAASSISPHKLRHYFVTKVVRAAGIYKAKELARHENIGVTALYTHLTNKELDKDYEDIFD